MKLQDFKVPSIDGLPSCFSVGIAFTNEGEFKQFLYVDEFIGEDRKVLNVSAYAEIDLPNKIDIEAYIKSKKLDQKRDIPEKNWAGLNKDGALLT